MSNEWTGDFDEAFRPDDLDPLAPDPYEQFDLPEDEMPQVMPEAFQAIADAVAALDEHDDALWDSVFESVPPHQLLRAMQPALSEIFRWLIAGAPSKDKYYQRAVARKLLAATWVLDPSLVKGLPLAAIARLHGVNCLPATLNAHANRFRDRFGIHNRAQRSEETRERMTVSALRRKKPTRRKKA